jgi:hypothetical protein
VRAGLSLLLTFEKQGFSAPNFGRELFAENVAVGLESYFSSLGQLISDNHVAEAKLYSIEVSKRAEEIAKNFEVHNWFQREF